MELNFLGRGSCFADDHASAFFITEDNDFVLIDCPEQSYQQLKNEFNLSTYNGIYVYITHTHTDHINGLGELIHYTYYALNKSIVVVAPSYYVMQDIQTILGLEGVESSQYEITYTLDFITSLSIPHSSIVPLNAYATSIHTEHALPLKGKCFGYQFSLNNVNVVYTGDTATLEPFIPLLKDGSELYVDTSVAHKSKVHLWLLDMLPALIGLTHKNVKVFLMHLDDAEKAKKFVETIPDIEVVKVF